MAPDPNILRSWVEASSVLPIKVTPLYPADWHARDIASPNFTASAGLAAAYDADVIITDCWPAGAHHDRLARYQISGALLDKCRLDALFLPCPPVTRGQEVTADAMEHGTCQSTVAKAYLLHAQNALLEWIAA